MASLAKAQQCLINNNTMLAILFMWQTKKYQEGNQKYSLSKRFTDQTRNLLMELG